MRLSLSLSLTFSIYSRFQFYLYAKEYWSWNKKEVISWWRKVWVVKALQDDNYFPPSCLSILFHFRNNKSACVWRKIFCSSAKNLLENIQTRKTFFRQLCFLFSYSIFFFFLVLHCHPRDTKNWTEKFSIFLGFYLMGK